MSQNIPIIDLGPIFSGSAEGKCQVAAEVGRALETVGFFCILGHDVPEALVRQLRNEAYKFFALPIEEKMKVRRPAPEITRGYDPPAQQSLSATRGKVSPSDLQEGFGMGALTSRRMILTTIQG